MPNRNPHGPLAARKTWPDELCATKAGAVGATLVFIDNNLGATGFADARIVANRQSRHGNKPSVDADLASVELASSSSSHSG